MIDFTIPGEPVAKGRPKLSTRGGFARAYTPAKTRQAEQTLVARALPYRPAEPLTEPLRLTAVFVFGYPKSMSQKRRAGAQHVTRPDLDNCVKLLKDALNEVFWLDDKQVVEVHARKQYGTHPQTRVVITGLNEREPIVLTDEDVPF